MELEFEYSLVRSQMELLKTGPDGAGNPVFDESDVAALKDRFREYLSEFKNAGLYGKAPVALYSGSNALTQLSQSPYPEDHALYLELCRFITESPLRSK